MAKHVLILGAGASTIFGAPVMSDFFRAAEAVEGSAKTWIRKDSFQRVTAARSKLKSVHSRARLDLFNLEEVFNAFEMAKLVNAIPGETPESLENLTDDLRWMIVNTIEHSMRFTTGPSGHLTSTRNQTLREDFLSLLKSNASTTLESDIAIITFNYDLGIEALLHSSGLVPYYGLVHPRDEPHRGPSHVPLLKLHGSVNWLRVKETEEIVPIAMSDAIQKLFPFGHKASQSIMLPIGSTALEIAQPPSSQDGFHDAPVIVPPAWNKSTSHKDIQNVWANAAKELSDSEYIYVVGYSLPETDGFFRQLYALGTLGDTIAKEFHVYNKDKERYGVFKNLLGTGVLDRYRYSVVPWPDCIVKGDGQIHSALGIREMMANDP